MATFVVTGIVRVITYPNQRRDEPVQRIIEAETEAKARGEFVASLTVDEEFSATQRIAEVTHVLQVITGGVAADWTSREPVPMTQMGY
ncbi:hypothetical protein [Belnapia sp. F-4-1]|uniref:hypothetical protein n=1 Tax=Belnapia sp. F-4-1 TaxID=1545443 RepID=UPI0005BC6000|nr:hypothetical protein [Belnapia sp. F-4-1]